MPYFNSRAVAAIAIFSGLWGILNSIFAPIVFRMFGLPILCDMVGFATLSVTVWWIRKLGAVTAVGIIATVVNFIFNPYGFHFLGFTVASVVFDIATKLMRYEWSFKNPLRVTISMLPVSALSASVAGLIIGAFFMPPTTLVTPSSILTWAYLHAVGGVIGGVIGVAMVASLTTRGIHRMDARQ